MTSLAKKDSEEMIRCLGFLLESWIDKGFLRSDLEQFSPLFAEQLKTLKEFCKFILPNQSIKSTYNM